MPNPVRIQNQYCSICKRKAERQFNNTLMSQKLELLHLETNYLIHLHDRIQYKFKTEQSSSRKIQKAGSYKRTTGSLSKYQMDLHPLRKSMAASQEALRQYFLRSSIKLQLLYNLGCSDKICSEQTKLNFVNKVSNVAKLQPQLRGWLED